MMFEVVCNEREGAIRRKVYLMPRTVHKMLEVVESLRKVPNFMDTSGNPYTMFTQIENTFFLVDDVGIIATFPYQKNSLHCHITFWDRKLRGREELCRTLAEFVCAVSKKVLMTAVPESSRAVLAFARRAGFEESYRHNDVVLLNFTNYTG